jgi:hypothetical protein
VSKGEKELASSQPKRRRGICQDGIVRNKPSCASSSVSSRWQHDDRKTIWTIMDNFSSWCPATFLLPVEADIPSRSPLSHLYLLHRPQTLLCIKEPGQLAADVTIRPCPPPYGENLSPYYPEYARQQHVIMCQYQIGFRTSIGPNKPPKYRQPTQVMTGRLLPLYWSLPPFLDPPSRRSS